MKKIQYLTSFPLKCLLLRSLCNVLSNAHCLIYMVASLNCICDAVRVLFMNFHMTFSIESCGSWKYRSSYYYKFYNKTLVKTLQKDEYLLGYDNCDLVVSWFCWMSLSIFLFIHQAILGLRWSECKFECVHITCIIFVQVRTVLSQDSLYIQIEIATKVFLRAAWLKCWNKPILRKFHLRFILFITHCTIIIFFKRNWSPVLMFIWLFRY